jgi:uncharacterized membrane protein HdeD (DUF308 family)
MNTNTKREIMGIVAIIVGIIFIVEPVFLPWLLGILLIIYGILELVNRGME